MEMIKDQADRFLQCWQFFTRIPLPEFLEKRVDHNEKLSNAAHLFPVVGLAIGSISALVWLIATYFLPVVIAAGITVLFTIVVTGALHEDGLSDCADGLFGGYTKERRLEIMKDSTIGTFGGLALIFSIALRWAILAHFSPVLGAVTLLVSHCGARAVMTYPICFSRYARNEGLAETVAQGMSVKSFMLSMLFSLIVALFLCGFAGFAAILLATLAGILFLKLLEDRIDGYTGDGLGAIEQIAEITILITLTAMWITP